MRNPDAADSKRVWHNEHVSDAAAMAGFDLVIFDEAHKLTKHMKGEETARFKLGKALSEAVPCFCSLPPLLIRVILYVFVIY